MSSNFNNAKIINVYYTKGDRKPYDVNGKPIAYIGEEYIGANEATELRFHFGEELDSASAIIVAKRANGDTRLDPLELVGTGVNSYFKVALNAWYAEYKGKMTIIFKVYNGTVTYDDPETPTQIVSTTGQIIVSDIFNLEVAYAPNASSLVPPFETEDYDDWFFTLSTKLDKAQSITVVGALPTLTGGVYDDRYFYVEDEGVGRLYYINGSTAIECVWGIGQINFATTNVPSSALTAGQMRYNDTTGSLDLGLKGDHVLKVGETVVKRVRNDEAVSLKVGQMVYVSGSVGNSGLLLVKKASNLGEATSSKTFGMVATAMNTTSSKDGYVYIYGLLQGIDLTDTDISESVFSSGDVGAGLWLGENGKITKTLPTADNKHSVFIGYLDSYGGAGSNCSIYVKIQNGYELNELHNVRIATLANNDVLRYNATRGVWVNSTTLTTAEANITDLQGRMTTEEANVDNLQSRMTTAESNIINIEDGTTAVGRAIADENGDDIPSTYLKQVNASATYIPLSQKGANNGVVPLNSNGKISSQYLSGEQDDYIEFANLASFPLVGEADIIYCAIDTGLIYRWTGSTYAVISPSLALGTTSTTAYRGDLGQVAYDNANTSVNAINIAGQANTQIPYWNSTNNRFESKSQLTFNPTLNRLVAFQGLIQDAFYAESISTANGTPSANIALSSTGTTISRNINDTNAPLKVNKVQGTGNILQLQSAGANKLEVSTTGVLTVNGKNYLTSDGTSNYLFTQANLYIQNASGGSNLGVITSAGNVGIGTTSPATKLDVNGVINTNNNISWANGNADINGQDANLKFRTWTGSALTEKMRITGAGNVGIGTTSPIRLLSLNASNTDGIQIRVNSDVTGNYGALGFRIAPTESTNNFAEIRAVRTNRAVGADSDLTFHTISNQTLGERMRIRDDGNVGIGTNSPGAKLHIFDANPMLIIQDSETTSSATDSRIRLAESGVSNVVNEYVDLRKNGDDFQIDIYNGATTITPFVVKYAGNVGIGTSSPGAKLHVVGGTRITGVVSVMNDTEVKRVLIDYDDALDVGIITAIHDGSAYKNLILNRDGANVGIGTTSPTATLHIKSDSTTKVPLIVDTLASHTALLQEWKLNGSNLATLDRFGVFRPSTGIGNISTSNNAFISVESNGTLISRNQADTNPALIVNLANASATGNIQVWQKAGTAKAVIDNGGYFSGAGIYNLSSSANSVLFLNNTGTEINRNINDANVVLKVKQQNTSATGRLQEWIYGTDVVSSVEKDGIANFTGTPSNAQTVDYTLVLADKGKVVRINSSSNLTVTIPLDSSVAFPIDTEIAILRYGTGTVSISPTSGVTLNSKNSERKISGQYGSVALKKIGTDEWVLVGSLEA